MLLLSRRRRERLRLLSSERRRAPPPKTRGTRGGSWSGATPAEATTIKHPAAPGRRAVRGVRARRGVARLLEHIPQTRGRHPRGGDEREGAASRRPPDAASPRASVPLLLRPLLQLHPLQRPRLEVRQHHQRWVPRGDPRAHERRRDGPARGRPRPPRKVSPTKWSSRGSPGARERAP